MAKNWGVPDFRFLDIPHPIANLTETDLDNRAETIIVDVIKLLKEGQT